MNESIRSPTPSDEIARLAEVLMKRTGLDYRGERLSLLASAVQRRMKVLGLDGVDTYMAHLERDPVEWQELINQISVTETSFYRHSSLVQGVIEALLRLHQSRAPGAKLVVWSAATATGQEAYTLAMAALESGLTALRPIVIWGTDINTEALEYARQARYPASTLNSLPASWREKYVVPNPDGTWSPTLEVRRLVRFRPYNLMDLLKGTFPPFVPDVIVCANVLIYFSPSIAKQILRELGRLLPDNGYLFVDSAVAYLAREVLSPVKVGDTYAYRPPQHAIEASRPEQATPFPHKDVPNHARAPQSSAPKEHPPSTSGGKARSPNGIGHQPQTKGENIPSIRSWDDLVPLIKGHRWQEAEKALLAWQEESPLAFEPYFFLARLHRMRNDLQKARKYYEQALYLCPSLSVGHLEYGNLLKLLGDLKGAYRAYRRAAQAASTDRYSQRYGFSPKLAARMAKRAISTLAHQSV